MNFDSALTNAQNDIIYRQEQLANRVDNLVIRMGQMLLPAKEWIVDKAETAVSRINWWSKSTDEKKEDIKQDQKEIVYEKYGNILSSAKTLPEEQYQKYVSAI